MAVIDFHSHILPGIDDGSKNLETSLELLRRSADQGVEVMAATPHFYAWQDRVERFLERRQTAWESLQEELTEDLPRVVLGAEAAFFPGISTAEQVDQLVLGETRLLLLEMPFQPWTASTVDEVEALIARREFQIILAHLERYLPMGDNRKYIRELLDMPLLVQINAESLLDWKSRGRLLKLFRTGQAHLLGSDCHSLHRRPPNLAQGREVLRRKLGEDFLRKMDDTGEELLLKGAAYV